MFLLTLYETVISIYLHMISKSKYYLSTGNTPLELYATRYQYLEEDRKVTERKNMYLYG